jgi:hypothetical protein
MENTFKSPGNHPNVSECEMNSPFEGAGATSHDQKPTAPTQPSMPTKVTGPPGPDSIDQTGTAFTKVPHANTFHRNYLSTSSRPSRKRSAPESTPEPRARKIRKTEPPVPLYYHGAWAELHVRPRTQWLGMPSKGKHDGKGKGKRKGEGESKGKGRAPPEQITPNLASMDDIDKDYLDKARETVSSASFLQHPQQPECIVGKGGACELQVVRPPRSTGIGQVQEGDSIYFIFLSQVDQHFICWICGHRLTIGKQLRALDHVRIHFGHQPFRCTGTWKNGNSEDAPRIPCSEWSVEGLRYAHNPSLTIINSPGSFHSKEGLRDWHKRRFGSHECPYWYVQSQIYYFRAYRDSTVQP